MKKEVKAEEERGGDKSRLSNSRNMLELLAPPENPPEATLKVKESSMSLGSFTRPMSGRKSANKAPAMMTAAEKKKLVFANYEYLLELENASCP